MRKLINNELLSLEEAYEKHKHLVFKVANRYRTLGARDGHELQDLESMGFFGFEKAYRNFDQNKGYQFSTLAIPYIDGYLKNELNRKYSFFVYTPTVKKLAMKYKQTGAEVTSTPLIMDALEIDYDLAYEVFSYILTKDPMKLETPVKRKYSNKAEGFIAVADAFGKNTDYMIHETWDFEKRLTARQRYVFLKMLEGHMGKDIAKSDKVTSQSIYKHVETIRNKYIEFRKEAEADGQEPFTVK